MSAYSLASIYKKAIVTGGAGFIGSHIVESLLADGLEVISVDDFSGGKRSNLAAWEDNPKLTIADCDITDKEALRQYVEGVDVIFNNAASKMTVCLRDPARDLAVNAEGALNVCELAREYGVRKIVHASTGSVYGEAQYFPTDENHPVNPTSYYGVSKLAGEKYMRVFSHLYDLNTTMLRYYHVFGPRQESSDVGGVASIFARRAFEGKPLTIFGDGTQMRSFTYVKDLVNINKLVAKHPDTQGEAYNCASGVQVTIQQLAEKILALMDRSDLAIEYKDWKLGDIKHFDVSNQKIRDLGFTYETDFDTGLANTINWARDYFANGGT